jgi:pathogenesis-related protein 1
MEKSPAGVLRVVLLLVATAGCAEVANVLGGSDDAPTPQPTDDRSADPTSGRASVPQASAHAGAGEPPAVAGITAAHNRVRARVGVPPLQWNAALAEVARRWANACVDREPPRGMIDHSSGRVEGFAGPLGENLYATTAPVAEVEQAVRSWADEAANYDYASNTCKGGVCGHYTQVAWRATREVGCAVGSCPRLQYRSTLVCVYAPAGNVVGQRPY